MNRYKLLYTHLHPFGMWGRVRQTALVSILAASGVQSYTIDLSFHQQQVFGKLAPKEKGFFGKLAGDPGLQGSYCVLQEGAWLTSTLDVYLRGIDVGDRVIEGSIEPVLQFALPQDTARFTSTLLPDSLDRDLFVGSYENDRFRVRIEYHDKNKTFNWAADDGKTVYRFTGVMRDSNAPQFPCPEK